MLERAVGKLGKGASRLVDRAATKFNEVTEKREKPEPRTLASTTFATPVSPLATIRVIQDLQRGALADEVDIVWPEGVTPRKRMAGHQDGRYVTRWSQPVIEQWLVDPDHVAAGQVQHTLRVTKGGARHEWPDHDYDGQLRRRDEAVVAALARASSFRIERLDQRFGKWDEMEVHWSGTVGGRSVAIDRRFMKGVMRAVGMDDLKVEAIDGTIDGEPFELRWDRGWVAGTIAGRPVHVESVSNRPATTGAFAGLDVARENHGAAIDVGPTTFDVVWSTHSEEGEVVVRDGDATGLDAAVLYVLREACAASGRDWA